MPASSAPVCDYENSRWRTDFWRGREYEDRAERIALAHLLPARGERLCEIGAGFGRLADFYRGYRRVILLDYARSMLRDARAQLGDDPRVLYVAANLYRLPLADNALDAVVTVRVLHHIADLPRAFAEIARVVRPRGVYVAEHANKRNLKAILRHAFGRGPSPWTLEPYEFAELNFDFHPRYIAERLRAAGFVIQTKRAVSIFRVAALKRIIPARALAALDGGLQACLAPLDLSPSIFFRAESRKPGAPRLAPALWRCLACGSTDVAESPNALTCRVCARAYPIVEGIIDLTE